MRPSYIMAGSLIFAGGSLILLTLYGKGSLRVDDASARVEIAARTSNKIEDRARAGEPAYRGSRTPLARPTARTELAAWAASSKAGLGAGNLWSHDGSILRLEVVGRARRFYYVDPHGGVTAKSGDIAFEGVREGPTYSGRAFQFTENCPPLAYRVKGSISVDEATLKIAGRKPRRDTQCHTVSYSDDELVFRLASKH
jgi:hypothetical protein